MYIIKPSQLKYADIDHIILQLAIAFLAQEKRKYSNLDILMLLSISFSFMGNLNCSELQKLHC